MDKEHVVITHHAVLIGINSYPEKPLKGCVQDVQAIKEYLNEMPISIGIQIFTATQTEDPNSCRPSEDAQLWPTYNNVKSGLEKIISKAKLGGFVYIHYSGHGTRMEPSHESTNQYTGDLALNLLEGVNGSDIRYLRGLELANLIGEMVTKRLMVTLALDCCFSGGISRHDDPYGVRSLPYNSEVDATYPIHYENLSHQADGLAFRNISMLPSWLINPDGYTILTACGPHEVAREVKFEDGQRHGALSYLLLRTLIKLSGSGKAQLEIYQHVRATFRKSCPGQNPILYGNKDLYFFGPLKPEVDCSTIPIVKGNTSNLILQAGQAHGVCNGDVFEVFPFFPTEVELGTTQEKPLVALVIKVNPLMSELELMNQEPSLTRIRTGWNAKALTRFSLQRYPIQLSPSLPDLHQWVEASKARSSLDVHFTDIYKYPFSFHVALDGCGEHEIRDESNKKILEFSTIKHGHRRDAGEILGIVGRLAWFGYVRDITNQASAAGFQESFTIRLINSSKRIFGAGQVIEVRDKEVVELKVQNKGVNALYLHIYNLGPQWHIENIFRGTYEVIPARDLERGFSGMTRRKLKMVVPFEMVDKGYEQCEDTIKIFITAKPTTFASLEMPKIAESAKTNPSAISSPITDPRSSGGGEELEDWVVLDFHFLTTIRRVHR
jgi:hypothetical protein